MGRRGVEGFVRGGGFEGGTELRGSETAGEPGQAAEDVPRVDAVQVPQAIAVLGVLVVVLLCFDRNEGFGMVLL